MSNSTGMALFPVTYHTKRRKFKPEQIVELPKSATVTGKNGSKCKLNW
ncbi:MAG: hypothetical protein ACTSQA_08970 [Candidatus Heimdallarchaeaceae archaeon]